MTREQIKQLWPILEAFRDGKTIQERSGDKWFDLDYPQFCRCPEDYRIKPKPIHIWVNMYPDGSMYPWASLNAAQMGAIPNARTVRFIEDPE